MQQGMLEPPWMVPVPIKTYSLPPVKRYLKLLSTRYFCLGKNWYYINSQGEMCVIPGAFHENGNLKDVYYVTDGKSYPRITRVVMNPLSVGLTEGLVHDFGYRYQCQIRADGGVIRGGMSRKECDMELRLVGIQTNNMAAASTVSYHALRIGGWPAWKHHRNRDGSDFNNPFLLLDGYNPRDPLAEVPVQKPFYA